MFEGLFVGGGWRSAEKGFGSLSLHPAHVGYCEAPLTDEEMTERIFRVQLTRFQELVSDQICIGYLLFVPFEC